MTVFIDELASPADADYFRMTVDWGRWYIDPLPTCDIAEADPEWKGPSFSEASKAAEGDWSFLVVNRLADITTDNLHAIAKLDPTQRRAAFKSHEDLAKQIAFGRGAIVHLWLEDLGAGRQPRKITDEWLRHANRGKGYPTAARDEAELYLPAILNFWDTYQPEPVGAEYVAIHRTLNGYGYGCTPDFLCKIEGERAGMDWKTRGPGSNHAAYPKEAGQIAAGARADYMIVRNGDTSRRQLIPQIDVGYVVSIKPDGARLYPVDIDKAWDHWCHLHEWWTHKLDEKKSIGRVKPNRSKIAAPPPPAQPSTGEGFTLSPTPVDEPGLDPSADAYEGRFKAPEGVIDEWQAIKADRRTALLARYQAMNDTDRLAFCTLNIDRDDLDKVEAALEQIEPFQTVDVPPAPTKTHEYKEGDFVVYKGKSYRVGVDNGSSVHLPDLPDHLATRSAHTKAGQWGYPEEYERWVQKKDVTPVLPSIPDEGATVADSDIQALKARFDALSDSAKLWTGTMITQGRLSHHWRITDTPTTRRYELYRGVMALAEWDDDGDDDGVDDAVRALVSLIIHSDAPLFPTLEPGRLLGMLDAGQATRFAELAHDLTTDRLGLVTDETTGTLRLIPTL